MEKFVMGMKFLDYVLKSIYNYDFPSVEYYKSLSFVEFIKTSMSTVGWIPKNYQNQRIKDLQQDRQDVNICPHYSVIEEVAGFVGIMPKELMDFNFFCGVFLKNKEHPADICGSHSFIFGQKQIPCRFCCIIGPVLDMFLGNIGKTVYQGQSQQILSFWSKKEGSETSKEMVIMKAEKALMKLKEKLRVKLDIPDLFDLGLNISCPQSPKFIG